jgi:radical SAM protein with 4Fe4S-binding SPASM domain
MIEVLQQYGYYPRACVWELTLRCNLRCKHCGSSAGASREQELTEEECLALADELVDLGCRRITLGGGEPTLHPAWDRIAFHLQELGAQVNMISNGFHWTEREIERALKAKMANVAFSLDGFEAAHDALRTKDSFRRVVAAIELNRKRGLATAVNTTINHLNREKLGEFRQFLAELGVFSWQLQFATPSGNLKHHPELVVKPEELLVLIPQIAEMRRDTEQKPDIHPGDDVGYYGKYEQALRGPHGELPFWLGCRAGCQVIGIESNGNVKGCLSLPSQKHGENRFVEGNIRCTPLASIWNDPQAFAYNRQYQAKELAGFCAVCRYRDFCRGGCSWTAYSHTQDRFNNPYCFYYQAVKHQRQDVLEEEPTPEEKAYFSLTSP